MDHILNDDDVLDDYLNNTLFPSIKKGDVTLFLGAGSSVSDKKFLGKEIIEYYEDKLRVDLGINDLVEFMDIISANPQFEREDFDNYIVSMLSKLSPSETHKVIASINWNQIITTNVDLVLERAFDVIQNTSLENKSFRIVRNISETYLQITNGNIKYMKLNGCISDKKKYPLIFSSKDFTSAKKFHNAVLKPLSDLPPEAKFISIGYSFTDIVANNLLKYFDSFNFRYKKPIICFDPFVQSGRLDYLKEKGIFVIKLDTDSLFGKYQAWEETYSASIVSRKSISFKNIRNESINIPSKLKLSLGTNIIQLCESSRIPSVSPFFFYQGEKPTYDIIRKNYDVIKSSRLDEVKKEIEILINKKVEKLVPVVFLTGSFGTGKSTFTYRLLHSITDDKTLNSVAFEFHDLLSLRPQDVGELFSLTDANSIFITCSEVEIDSSFKELMDFRNKISVEQFSKFNIFFIVSIRENILLKFLKNYQYKNVFPINVDSQINDIEAEDLVIKLSSIELVKFRDVSEKKRLINRITTEFQGDTFISLISLITNNNFEEIILSAYHQLSKTAKDAFLFTSILYQYKILMPSALLMRVVSSNWVDFEKDVLRYDSKGILIQEYIDSSPNPDLYFRTRHSIVSQYLINKVLKNEDQKFEKFKIIISQLIENDFNAKLFVDFIKAVRINKIISEDKISKLFDLGDKVFEINPHFVLYYTVNLQLRRTMGSIKKGIDKIKYAESFLEYRNNRLVQRRAVLHYELAKLYHNAGNYPSTIINIEEARELFEIKKIEDPGSSYSYTEYINLELWVLNNLNLEQTELLLLHIRIQDLFDIGTKAVSENIDRILKLKYTYFKHIETISSPSNTTLLEYLDELYQSEETRPYSLVLKYNYFREKDRLEDAKILIPELENLIYNDEVAKLLFTYYGRNLNIVENRRKFFKIIKSGYEFNNRDRLRYHFYSYMAESYNLNFSYANDHIQSIMSLDTIFNPDLHEIWQEEDGTESLFTGIIYNTQRGFTNLKISENQLRCRLMRDSNVQFNPKPSEHYSVKLHFFIKGIRAELIEKL